MFAQAIRPPTVPAGGSRLRLTVMASHTKSELRDAAKWAEMWYEARRSLARLPDDRPAHRWDSKAEVCA